MDRRYDFRYTPGVKTAISIPDELFDAADALAERLGVSRSRLYAMALEEFVRRRHAQGITEALDEVYSEQTGALDPALRRAQSRAVGRDEGW